MRNGKKGAIELSTNAIVVLILAVVMLGLGLGFVRGLFGKATQNIESIVGQEPDPPTPTSSNPVTLSRENVIVQAKEPIVVKVSAFNPTSADWTKTHPQVSCSGITLVPTVLNSTVPSGGFSTFSVVLPTTAGTTKGTYLCRAKIMKEDSSDSTGQKETGTYLDFTVQVK
ncbi:hypothetical protein HYV84_05330 [Candidatus Woesearchaeota archaeon]|nr:hypothetical protein [Candidatus Woesearchaeota archaeon]